MSERDERIRRLLDIQARVRAYREVTADNANLLVCAAAFGELQAALEAFDEHGDADGIVKDLEAMDNEISRLDGLAEAHGIVCSQCGRATEFLINGICNDCR